MPNIKTTHARPTTPKKQFPLNMEYSKYLLLLKIAQTEQRTITSCIITALDTVYFSGGINGH